MASPREFLCPLFRRWQTQPAHPFLVHGTKIWTAADLEFRVRQIVARLQQEGVAEGRRIGLWVEDPVRTVTLLLALWRLRAVACLLSTRLPASGLAAFIRQVGLEGLVVDRPVTAEIPVWPVEVLEAGGKTLECCAPLLTLDQPAAVFFTSGSTGAPKGVLHALGQLVWSARGAQAIFSLKPGDRWLLVLPLYHVGGMGVVMRCLLYGATIVVPERQEPIGAAMARYGVTHASLVHTQLWRLLRAHDGPPPPALRAVLLGGSAVPEALLAEGVGRGWPLHMSYGLTETASLVTVTPSGATPEVLRTAGRVLPYREVRLGHDGTIWVRGAVRFMGYVEAGRLVQPFDPEGWFDTGDLGAWDAQGYLQVTGRRDNQFISGGENIQPETIEAALLQLSGIAQAVVVPVADEEFGQRPAAFVQLAEGAAWAPERWRAQLRAVLPGFMIPVAFWPWPMQTAEGVKVSRAWLEREAAHRWQQKGQP
ncbi:o-succinylbenzoate--CoA ligase [Rhodothermus bifroesti]|uniref:O-succinylbenzoate--CoA ligase n=1 Tax=Rhodothermus marinus TaxID=29549 RepID=A0A7V2F6B2_RHOMR|nr:o-succinylbenzoate--CoA ligase [Rhodothermus bifroesti]